MIYKEKPKTTIEEETKDIAKTVLGLMIDSDQKGKKNKDNLAIEQQSLSELCSK